MRRSAAWLVILAAPLLGAADQSPQSLSKAAAALRAEQAKLEAERQATERARLEREAIAGRQASQASAAAAAFERSLATVSPAGGDGLASSAAAALAAEAAFLRQTAARDAERAAQEAADLAEAERQAALAVASLEAEASAREKAAREAAAREQARRSAARRAVRKAEITRTPARPSGGAPRNTAVTVALVDGGGDIIREFGAQTAGGPPAKGITLRTRPGAAILAPRAGRVIHTGMLQAGGQVLILEVGQGYLLVFAGLGELSAAKGARLQQGDRLGAAPGIDPAVVQFEVRKNGLGVDPLIWLAAGR